MKLLSLSVRSIGPYADEQIVDFTKFGHNPIFLIEGPTGAGKSTILNAITFAFYGEAGIDTSQNKRLLCDHCIPDGTASVILMFEVRGQAYRIIRKPKYHPPKLKNEKPETVELSILNDEGEWADFAEQKRETDLKIKHIIGLTAEQFAQVIVLPQGQFREIITSSSAVREKIYATLFSTTMYQDITNHLLEQYKKLKSDNAHGLTQRANLFASVEVQNKEALNTKIEAATTVQQDADSAYKTAVAEQTKAQQTIDKSSALAELFTKHVQALAEQARLNASTASIAQHQRTVKQIEAALYLAPFAQQRIQANGRLDHAVRDNEQKQADLETRHKQLEQTSTALAQATQSAAQIPALNTEKTTLDTAQKQLTQLEQIITQQTSKQQHVGSLQQGLTQATQQVEADEARLTKLLSDITTQQDIAKTESSWLTKLHAAQQVKTQIVERDKVATNIKEAEASIAKGKTAIAEQEQVVSKEEQARQTLQMHWHQNQAYVLAQTLQSNAPCLVCGSTEHPEPAKALVGVPNVTQEAIDDALKVEQDARVKLEQYHNRFETVQTELKQAQVTLQTCLDALGEHRSLSESDIDTRIGQLQTHITQAQQASRCVVTLQQQAKTLQQSIDSQRTQIQTSVNTIEGLKGQLTQLQQDHDELITQIPDSMRDTAAVNARLQTVTSTISRLEHALCEAQKAEQNATNTLAAAQANAENAQKQLILEQEALDKATKEWETQLAKSPLSDEAAYQAAIQQTEQSDTLKEQITSHDNALTANTVLLAQLDEQLQDKQRPDLEALQTVLENTQAKVTETLAQRDDANRELQRLTHVADELTKLDAANHNLRAQLDAIEPLAKIANGDTDNKVSLHRYVLGVMLDDVLSVASDHLTHMTRGQFHFERLTDSKGRGGKGLDLGVVDNHTGTLREVSSLSGGESFIASMALALALSQVVQEYAGGIQLETLFIDEGFGSLDSDILQLVINVLSDLQASGRAVGLVSHVEHMKDQFPNKILVHKDSQGSRLEVECVA